MTVFNLFCLQGFYTYILRHIFKMMFIEMVSLYNQVFQGLETERAAALLPASKSMPRQTVAAVLEAGVLKIYLLVC